MNLILGPMDGVLDAPMRELLTQINTYSLCVTEFVRVVESKLAARAFYKLCPELHQDGKTAAGTPVRVQLLGQSPFYLAENAQLAAELGSSGIDLNFGCPSNTVNGSKGGAVLLKEPELIYQIVTQVRAAIPKEHILSCKIRLGFDDCSSYREIADAVIQGGANQLIVHGRSKIDGYKAETIRWDLIGAIKQNYAIDVIANGEIWRQADAKKCAQISQCDSLMLCRGALAMPNLGAHILQNSIPMPWFEVMDLLIEYAKFEIPGDKGLYYGNRIKQWLRFLLVHYPQARELFMQVRCHNDKKNILNALYLAKDELNKIDHVA